jgi:hypothetical protein
MGQVSANVKDSSSLANIPVDGVSVAAAGAAITGGQALRNCFVQGKSDGTATYADPDGAGNLQVNLKTAIPAGANTIGNVGGTGTAGTPAGGVLTVQGAAAGTPIPITAHTVSSRIVINPTISTSVYTLGNNVGGLLVFPNAFGAANSGVLESIAVAVAMTAAATQTAGFTFYLLSGKPATSPTDNAAYAISVADAKLVLGDYALSSGNSGLGTASNIFNLDGIGAQAVGTAVNGGTATTLYGIITTLGTPTYTSTALWISVGVLQD